MRTMTEDGAVWQAAASPWLAIRQANATNSAELNVPRTGWYGVFVRNNGQRQRDDDVVWTAAGSLQFDVEFTVDESGSQESLTRCKHQVIIDGNDARSNCLGPIFRLEQGSTVWCWAGKAEAASPQCERDAYDANNICPSAELWSSHWQWRLVFYRLLEDRPNHVGIGGASHDGPDASQNHPNIMCAPCRRAFASIAAARQHYRNQHAPMQEPPLVILYEDDYLLAVHKPQGLAVMGDRPSLLSSPALERHVTPPDRIIMGHHQYDVPLRKPRPVHRLDAGTGGVLVIAKTQQTEVALKAMFARQALDHHCRRDADGPSHIVMTGSSSSSAEPSILSRDNDTTGVAVLRKTYQAIVRGRLGHHMGDAGTCRTPIGGKPARTTWTIMSHHCSSSGWCTLVELHLHTGRKHQIRRHMQQIGHPILGDWRYGGGGGGGGGDDAKTTAGAMQKGTFCLWAVKIELPHHPITGGAPIVIKMQDSSAISNILDQHGATGATTTTTTTAR